MNTDGSEFQYDLLGSLGSQLEPASLANGHANKEEQFISLLDVIEDDNQEPPKIELEPERPPQPAAASQDPAGPSGRVELPWARASRNIASPTLRLHNEIVEFCRFLEPTPEEEDARQSALQRISDLVCSIFPSAKIQLFGSYLTGLYLPTSDMDVVVTNSGCDDIPRALRAIGNALVEEGMGKSIQVISKAKVPIVKFDDVETGLAFDISFDVANGPKTAEYVVKLMKGLPGMSQLVKILKLFLQQREFNEVYQGGIGSYALLVMVAAFMMQHPSRDQDANARSSFFNLEGNLGILLLDFFRLYGRTLDVEHVAVSCRKAGTFFTKRSNPAFMQRDRPYFLAVEDPQDSGNDLSKGSYNISRVQKAFDFAYQQLSSPIDPMDSALERILRLDAVLMSRTPAEPLEEQPPPELTLGERIAQGQDQVVGRGPNGELSKRQKKEIARQHREAYKESSTTDASSSRRSSAEGQKRSRDRGRRDLLQNDSERRKRRRY